jgi:SAM-dependent methyltransferase
VKELFHMATACSQSPATSPRPEHSKTLVLGWFSFEEGHATAGDLRARDVVCGWLDLAGRPYDCATAPPFRGGVDWRRVDPSDYPRVVFVCGPFGKGQYEAEFLDRFAGSTIFGVDLSMLERLDEWNPFDLLLERDSSGAVRPDVVFGAARCQVPVVGVCLVEPYEGGEVDAANDAIRRLTATREMAVVEIDTRLDANDTGLHSPAEVESLIARMDVLVTTRLHGLVFALKNGVPALAIDVENGGAKLVRQARTIGWPVVSAIDSLTDASLQEALAYCLTDEARGKARECGRQAAEQVSRIGREFMEAMASPVQVSRKARLRSEFAAPYVRAVPRTDEPSPNGSPEPMTRGTMSRRAVGLAKKVLPPSVRRSLSAWRDRPPAVRWGGMRRLDPVARGFFDRGCPVDRYYIEQFLENHREDIRGTVLEIADAGYTRRFGGARVTRSDVLHAVPGNPEATIVGDLASGKNIPTERYDCIILTQTLLCIFDVSAALRHAHRALKPGGTLLVTVPGISQICRPDYDLWGDYWRFTTLSLSRLLGDVFGDPKNVRVESHGNVLMALAFLNNLAVHEFRPDELNHRDPDYELLITARAVKAGSFV